MAKIKAEQEKISYACLPDAQAAVERLPKGKLHRFVAQVRRNVRYTKGRPKADGIRNIAAITYSLTLEVERDEAAIARAEQKAGCFVLISNTLRDEPNERAPENSWTRTRIRGTWNATSDSSKTTRSSTAFF